MLAKSKRHEPWAEKKISAITGFPKSQTKQVPKPFKIRRYYTPEEVALHNTADDCWLSFFGYVFDMTKLLTKSRMDGQAELCVPIEAAAGTDITNWFDPITLEPKRAVDRTTNLYWWHCPYGRYLHIPPIEPDSAWDTEAIGTPWWKDESLRIG